ncbi:OXIDOREDUCTASE 2OG-FE II OXYGENASE FAMILY PROTEIN [Salix purpurea]|uniref:OXIDOREDUCTASE 2OG-FE II OXYGENASE FAMILY PROTEIN n=1 Tax=Salix purpurea TaxID=77065 RepID=A0A9Q1A0J1_SALPP|nr:OXIDOREDUCTASE 2OG-FE II OXYGENASE FAMILY PROTEIN [Salix purpurea]
MSNLLLADLAASGVKQIPSGYIRPITDRPNLSDVQISQDSIPLIDLHGLNGPSRSLVIKQISQACENDGFFQVRTETMVLLLPSLRHILVVVTE